MSSRAHRRSALVTGLLCGLPLTCGAQMSLTPDGISDGFVLSTVVSNFPVSTTVTNGCCGPFGSASTADGHLLVASYDDSKIYVFKDADGQTLSSALSSSAYQAFAPALTNDRGTVYASGGIGAPFGVSGTGPDGGPNAYHLVQLDNSGAVVATILTDGGVSGVATKPTDGHLITEGVTTFVAGVPQTQTLLNVDPLAKTSALLTSWPAANEGDGVVVSADGSTAYVAFKASDTIVGYDTLTGAQVFSITLTSTPDGLGVIQGSTSLAGDLVSNNNDGTLDLIDVGKDTATVIASGGSRGDYSGQDLLNGTLLLSQTDSLLRLSCGRDCSFGGSTAAAGGATTSVPEPATLGLLGVGLLGIRLARLLRVRRLSAG